MRRRKDQFLGAGLRLDEDASLWWIDDVVDISMILQELHQLPAWLLTNQNAAHKFARLDRRDLKAGIAGSLEDDGVLWSEQKHITKLSTWDRVVGVEDSGVFFLQQSPGMIHAAHRLANSWSTHDSDSGFVFLDPRAVKIIEGSTIQHRITLANVHNVGGIDTTEERGGKLDEAITQRTLSQYFDE
eukprot:Lithocolla_globosa_v1_NODE_6_length_11976_cov_15.425432.p10 type:complete len:186 gc:universal NODE_6_length_11976_cov_15.425432:3620-4177(+)